ncbi:MAG: phage protein Gp36 family protein [Mucinivorans sp.]
MYLSNEELRTHLRSEYTDLISRGDQTLLTAAIDGAVAEAAGYLSSFDTDKIFTTVGAARNSLLLIFVKDIAVYHFINLCGGGVYYERREKRYEQAIAWLRGVQKGVITPSLPPRIDELGKQSTPILIASNPKRGNHF